MDTSQLRIAVTGGTSGLGLALVREWHRRGARVAFVARTRENVDRIAAELAGSVGIVGDISVKEQIHPIALQVLGQLGGLDVLVNSASSLGPVALQRLADTDCAAAGTVVWPALLYPHATMEPSTFNATLWYIPAAMATTPLRAAAGTCAWP